MSVFNESNQDSGAGNDNTNSFLDQLVGEGKKFSSVEEMAKGKLESDRYIGELETRLESMNNQRGIQIGRTLEATFWVERE